MSDEPDRGGYGPHGFDPPAGQRWLPPVAPQETTWKNPGVPTPNSKATAALWLGVCGIIALPVVLSTLAVVLGLQAKREIASSEGRQTGEGNAQAGVVLGCVGLVFGLCAAVYLATR
jgi:hypothetical protein